ncbi:MAG TPA: ABC transporter permease [Verrucomicrobiae bacterium]|jgi:phospholipid/cholesterol/gamma-HCH transport system permease protein|nr:ABC transporter permease [Verrucomicrobiae bacterium]
MTLLAKNWIKEWFGGLGQGALLCREIFQSLCRNRPSGKDLVYQMYFIGVKSQSVVAVTGAFTGMVLCAQSYIQFHKIQLDTATLAVVSVSMCAELGPVLTALMVAGRVGAAIAAEIGTMKVTEQIDALRTLATHPVDYLVAPRFLATLLVMPLLTAESICLGIFAAYVIGSFLLGINPTGNWYTMLNHTSVQDVVIGMIKAFIFGGIIAVVACFKGLNCAQGAEGVGRATTEAVVNASITILITNFFLTLFLTRLLE